MKNIGNYACHINVNQPWFGELGLIVNVFYENNIKYYTLCFFDKTRGDVLLTFKESELLFQWELSFNGGWNEE
jgi:hypothetical protein